MTPTAYTCPNCKCGSIVTRRKTFKGGHRQERICLAKGHRWATFTPVAGQEWVTAILKPVEPPMINPAEIGRMGCNEYCSMWDYCNHEKPAFLPCEVFFYPDENPAALDTAELTRWPGLRLQMNEGAR